MPQSSDIWKHNDGSVLIYMDKKSEKYAVSLRSLRKLSDPGVKNG